MILLPVRAQCVYNIVKNPKTLRCANKMCHKIMGAGIKETVQLYDALWIIDTKIYKNILKRLSKFI